MNGMIFTLDSYSGQQAKAMAYMRKLSQLATREELIDIALHYPRGLSNAKTFNAVGLPFS